MLVLLVNGSFSLSQHAPEVDLCSWHAYLLRLHTRTHRPMQTCEPDTGGIWPYSAHALLWYFRILWSLFLHIPSPYKIHRAYPWRKVAIFTPCLASLAMWPKDGRPPSRTTLAVCEGQALPWGSFCARHRGPSDCAPGRQPSVYCWDAQAPHGAEGCKVTWYRRKQDCKDIPCLSQTYLIITKINYVYLESVQNMTRIS